jgi:hypothetical protein
VLDLAAHRGSNLGDRYHRVTHQADLSLTRCSTIRPSTRRRAIRERSAQLAQRRLQYRCRRPGPVRSGSEIPHSTHTKEVITLNYAMCCTDFGGISRNLPVYYVTWRIVWFAT